MSWTFFCHNVPVLQECVWTAPSGDITAETIFLEDTELIPTNHDVNGIMGVSGSRIIACPGGRKIISSTDMGDTWTETDLSLPVGYVDPTNSYLKPTMWQWINNRWYTLLKESHKTTGVETNQGFLASTVDGTSWVVGSTLISGTTYGNLTSDRGIRLCARWEFDGSDLQVVTAGGFRGAPGDPVGATSYGVVARYADEYGSHGANPATPTYVAGGTEAGNTQGILPLSNGYFRARLISSGSTVRSEYVDSSLSSITRYGTNWTVNSYYAGNGVDCVLLAFNSTQVYQWSVGVSNTMPTLTIPVGGSGQLRYSYNNNIWFFANCQGNSTWETAYSVNPDGSSPVASYDVLRPSNSSTTGSDVGVCNVMAADDGYFIAFYKDTTGRFMRIIRWQYGTYTGACAFREP